MTNYTLPNTVLFQIFLKYPEIKNYISLTNLGIPFSTTETYTLFRTVKIINSWDNVSDKFSFAHQGLNLKLGHCEEINIENGKTNIEQNHAQETEEIIQPTHLDPKANWQWKLLDGKCHNWFRDFCRLK